MTKAIFFSLLLPTLALANTQLSYDQADQTTKKVDFKKIECYLENFSDGTLARFHIYAGQHQKDIQERFELLLLNAADLPQGESKIMLADPEKEGTVCLVTYDEKRYVPHQTFCLNASQKNSCEVTLNLDNQNAKVSMKCTNLGRAIKPGSPDRVSFEIPASHPIECKLDLMPQGKFSGTPFAK